MQDCLVFLSSRPVCRPVMPLNVMCLLGQQTELLILSVGKDPSRMLHTGFFFWIQEDTGDSGAES